MGNSEFFTDLFSDYWAQVDRSTVVEDTNSFFGNEATFEWLITMLRPLTIVEVGSWKGHSANHMADLCKRLGLSTRLVAVDTYLGSIEHWLIADLKPEMHFRSGRPTMLERFQGNTLARRNDDMLVPFCIDSINAARVFTHFQFRADLIYLDASHGYDEVTADIKAYWPLLSAGGVVFGDDYHAESVQNAVHDCARALGVGVVVSQRKWIYVNPALGSRLFPPGFEVRTSGQGYVLS